MRNGTILAASSYVNSKTEKTWIKMLVQEESGASIIHLPLGAVPEENRDEVEDTPSLLKGGELFFEFLEVGAILAGSEEPVRDADKFLDLSKTMLVFAEVS
jgi:hypothetical protein